MIKRMQPQLRLEPSPKAKPPEPPHCAFCGGLDGTIQFTATCRRGRLEVHEAWLHPDCERDYLAKIDPTC